MDLLGLEIPPSGDHSGEGISHVVPPPVHPQDNKNKRKREGEEGEYENKSSKKYACDVPNCTYETVYSRDFKRHQRVHSNEKPFKCEHLLASGEMCSYSASRMDHLKTHMRIHTGDKPYKCDAEGCSYACTQVSALKKHKFTHSGDKPYKCDRGCDYKSTKKEYLRMHMEKVHGIDGALHEVADAAVTVLDNGGGLLEAPPVIIPSNNDGEIVKEKRKEHWI